MQTLQGNYLKNTPGHDTSKKLEENCVFRSPEFRRKLAGTLIPLVFPRFLHRNGFFSFPVACPSKSRLRTRFEHAGNGSPEFTAVAGIAREEKR